MDKFIKNYLHRKKSVFSLFLLISLLLHLSIGLLLKSQHIVPEKQKKPEQTAVALQERKNWLELDRKPPENVETPPKEATHIAESNAKVKQEAVPKGDDSRDKKKLERQEQRTAQQTPTALQKKQKHQKTPSPPSPLLQADSRGEHNPAAKKEQEKLPDRIPVNLPKLSKLTNLSPKTLARLDRQQQRERNKNRPEIELKEDEVWLNLRQNDKLISFFRRFSDRIEAVWNYPVEASSRGVEGTLLIKIIVNKKGELIDAFPLESSGSEILDYEAITAVYRAAPFGELPSYYKHDQLKIFAHFQYRLSRRMLYGNPYN